EALIHQALAKPKKMAEAMGNFVSLKGTRPDAGFYPPTVVRAYDLVKQQATTHSTAVVEVRPSIALDSPVELIVDGARMGSAPGSFSGFIVGPHHLKLKALGHQSFEKIVWLQSGLNNFGPTLKPLSSTSLALTAAHSHDPQEMQQLFLLL